jgi:hypothetical protein
MVICSKQPFSMVECSYEFRKMSEPLQDGVANLNREQ